ncbi:hypothetical protein [uncultured Amnibacterium sp.]|uniref:hypothetical protein n=1 Tax=uncultured Amnibacterium sp. TaxID=1631851 RepID=UPI0035CC8B9B
MTLVDIPSPRIDTRATAPERAASGHASGPVPYRALLLGGRLLADVTTPTRQQPIADALAAALAARTGHGVDVQTSHDPSATAVADLLASDRDVSRLDALVVVLAPRRDGRTPAETRERLATVLADLTARLTVASALVVVVPSPLASGLTRHELDGFSRTVAEAADALVRVVRLEDGDPSLTPEERAALWAGDIAERTAGALVEPMVRFAPDDPFDEFLRVDAVERIEGRYGVPTAEFQELVELARSTYGTAAAAMSLIDDERTHYFARTGGVAESLPRGKTVCNRVMRLYGGLIVGDAALDPRLSALPEVRTRDVVFYAGYRIEGPDGAPLGALCVFDDAPRVVDDADLAPLRDLVIRAERLLAR